MSLKSRSTADSMILVTDPAGLSIPTWDGSSLIATGPDCVLIRCRNDKKSKTEVQLGQACEVHPGYPPVALRTLLTPSRVLVIGSVAGEILGRLRTLDEKTSILIWVNDQNVPDHIAIGLFSADSVKIPSPPDEIFCSRQVLSPSPMSVFPWRAERLSRKPSELGP